MAESRRVQKAYHSPYAEPLTWPQGQRLRFERKESEWAGWLWCKSPSGEARWVPENWVSFEGEFCILQRDYTATELSVEAGERLGVEFEESSWAWAAKADSQRGWVPLAYLEPPETAAPYQISDAEQARMLRKLLLYWDGQWFLKTVEAHGLDAAIELNAQVREAFGRIEMRLLLKTLGKTQADDLPDALRLLETYADVFMGRTLRAEFVTQADGGAEVVIRRCAAHEGAKRAALPRSDQACIACEGLWNAWLETLLPGAHIDVQYPSRMGLGDLACRFVIQTSRPIP